MARPVHAAAATESTTVNEVRDSTRSWRARFVGYARGEREDRIFDLLAPASLGMRWIQRARNALYDARRLPVHALDVPVISVGNLTFGGTNKTPVVAWLAQCLEQRGLRVGIATRGYGRRQTRQVTLHRGGLVVETGDHERVAPAHPVDVGAPGFRRDLAGDEPSMLAQRLPDAWIAVGRDRVAGAHRLAALGAEVILLDDGFQHRRLARTLDIVLVDARHPFGNGRLIPAGSLREPPSALRRADQLLVTRSEVLSAAERDQLARRLADFLPSNRLGWATSSVGAWGTFVAMGDGGPEVEWSDLEAAAARPGPGRLPSGPFFVFSAIAHPRSLCDLIEATAGSVVDSRTFPDHHRLTPAEFAEVVAAATARGAAALACSEKDLHNLPSQLRAVDVDLPLWVPRLEVRPESEEWFASRVESALAGSLRAE